MPETHTAPTLVNMMSKETFEYLTEKREFSLAPFKSAFATVAHKHDIWHHREKEQYNYFFRQVMAGVKRLMKRPAASKLLSSKKETPSPSEPQLEKLQYTIPLF